MPKPTPAIFSCVGPTCNECCKVNDPDPAVGYAPVDGNANIEAMATALGMDVATFKSTYLNVEETAILADPVTGVCKLWVEGVGCTVYAVKPSGCTRFPNDPKYLCSSENARSASAVCPYFQFPKHYRG